MRYWQNIKNYRSNFRSLLFIVLCCTVTACIDDIPKRLKQGENLARDRYYGFRSDKWSEVEASYLAGKAACCGNDKLNDDDVRALNLYCKSAKYGHKASMVEIGQIYMHNPQSISGPGTPIPYDRTLAYTYFSKAAENGYDYAASMKNDLGKKLSKEELTRATALEAEFPEIACQYTR